MTNPVKGSVSFEFDGNRYNIALTVNAWCELEEEFDQTTDEILKDFAKEVESGKIIMRKLRKIFRAGLGMEATDEEAGRIMAGLGTVASVTLLGEAIALSMPDMPNSGADTGKKPVRRNGKTG